MDYIRLLFDLSQSRAPCIWDSIQTDLWGPLVSGASGPKFLKGGKYAAEAENICDNLPRALYQLPLESVPATTSHLSPFPSTEGHRGGASTTSTPELLPRRPLPPHRRSFPIVHYLRTGAASPSATTSAPDLLPSRPLPPHRSCFSVGHYLCTRATPPSSTTSTPDLLPHQLLSA